MGLTDWIRIALTKPITQTTTAGIIEDCGLLGTQAYVKMLAVNAAVNLIKNTLMQSEFKTYEVGKEVRKTNYYLFNVEPNLNYSASRFWGKVVRNLVWDNEALVLQREGDNKLYVADRFNSNQYAFKKNVYFDVSIEGKDLAKTWSEQDVLHFQLHNDRMRGVIEGLYIDYGSLIEHSKGTYKRSNARRGTLDIPTDYPQDPESQKKLNGLLQNNFKKFFEAETGAVLPLSNGLTYNDLTNNTYKNGSDSRDIRALIDDIFDYVAIAFQIPPQMLKGSVVGSGDSWDSYMTFCINPLAETLEDEINRKMYGQDDYLKRTYLKIDTSHVKREPIKDLANAIDILTRNGVNTLDDNLKLIGREPIGGEEGGRRLYTKNYDDIERVGEGGE